MNEMKACQELDQVGAKIQRIEMKYGILRILLTQECVYLGHPETLVGEYAKKMSEGRYFRVPDDVDIFELADEICKENPTLVYNGLCIRRK